ncbi:MAG: 30S ribosomal protein S20 [Eubacteriales bacterium]|nr:30S ribosomal protein S20 [Eubacteriales bacterium]
MANIKSAKKRISVTKTKTDRNKAINTKVKTFIKKVEKLVNDGNKTEAEAILKEATKQINMAKSKGVIHKNNASRKVSRITKAVSTLK